MLGKQAWAGDEVYRANKRIDRLLTDVCVFVMLPFNAVSSGRIILHLNNIITSHLFLSFVEEMFLLIQTQELNSHL